MTKNLGFQMDDILPGIVAIERAKRMHRFGARAAIVLVTCIAVGAFSLLY